MESYSNIPTLMGKTKIQNKYIESFMTDSPFITKKDTLNTENFFEGEYQSSVYKIEVYGNELVTFDEDVFLCIINSPCYINDKGKYVFKISQSDLRKQLGLEKKKGVYQRIKKSILKLSTTKVIMKKVSDIENGISKKTEYKSILGDIVEEEIILNKGIFKNKPSIQVIYHIEIGDTMLDKYTNGKVYIYNLRHRLQLEHDSSKSLHRYLSQHTNYLLNGNIKESIFNMYEKTKMPLYFISLDKTKENWKYNTNVRWSSIIKNIDKMKEDLIKLNIQLDYEMKIECKGGNEKFKNLYITLTNLSHRKDK